MIRTISYTLLLVAATVTAFYGAEARPPNILFIMVDDLGWSDVGFNGSKFYETPNVDHLASQGMVLSDFYAGGPVCSPTRASILTGKYTARTGISTYLLSPIRDAKHVQSHLPLEEFTIAEAFKKNGYATGYFGKWHLGYENEYWATNQGFDVALGGIDLPWAWDLCYPDINEAPTAKTWPKTHTRFFSPYHLTHLDNGPPGEYLTERLTNETISFIEKHRHEPFFAFLSFHTVHTPLQARPEKIEKYRRKIDALGLVQKKEKDRQEKMYQNNPAYAAMVEHMDENVGRLLRRLDALQLSDNTIVVWTSDNGGKGSVTSNLPLRGMKHNLYEGGIRVPTIVRWPKKIAEASRNKTPLISNDFYPTLLALAGLPLEPQQHVDGISFRDILIGETDSVDRDTIYWHYPHNRHEAAIRTGRYKLLHRFKEDSIELYDLKEDLSERHNLNQTHPEITIKLLRKLKQWQKEVGAKFEGEVWHSDTQKETAILLEKDLPSKTIEQAQKKHEKQNEYLNRQTVSKELTIVAFGDSTTAPRNNIEQVYSDRLPTLLRAHGLHSKVLNAGVGGSHTGRLSDNAHHQRDHALDRFNAAVRSHQPDVVIVQFGWNDSWIDSGTSGDSSRIPIEDYVFNLQQIVGTLRQDGSHVILMTPNRPSHTVKKWQERRTLQYVNRVRKLADQKSIPLIDVWAEYERLESTHGIKPSELLVDHLHPNDKGHELVAKLLTDVIVNIHQQTAPESHTKLNKIIPVD